MQKHLSLEDIDPQLHAKISIQNYSTKTSISGVKTTKLVNHVGEDGDFSEILRINENGEVKEFADFKIAQINRARINVGAIKAWHLHFKQDEIWYVPPSVTLFVGLWDVRKDSETRNSAMRVVLGGGNSQLLFIPKGVAHGCANFTEKPVDLFYFINEQFDIKDPDEKRISWDALGNEFWLPQVG